MPGATLPRSTFSLEPHLHVSLLLCRVRKPDLVDAQRLAIIYRAMK
jgi:hypothetical protein